MNIEDECDTPEFWIQCLPEEYKRQLETKKQTIQTNADKLSLILRIFPGCVVSAPLIKNDDKIAESDWLENDIGQKIIKCKDIVCIRIHPTTCEDGLTFDDMKRRIKEDIINFFKNNADLAITGHETRNIKISATEKYEVHYITFQNHIEVQIMSEKEQQYLEENRILHETQRNLIKVKEDMTIPFDRNELVHDICRGGGIHKIRLMQSESIKLITDCIAYGRVEAKKAIGKDIALFVGETGSGKSTLVNYLAGCSMIQKTIDYINVIDVIPVSEGGRLDNLMKMGHGIVSETLLPYVKDDPSGWITYCDCPGYLDNRGPEINIANAVNVKEVCRQAGSIRIVLVVEYGALTVNRGDMFVGLLKIVCDFFGGYQNVVSLKESILFVLTKKDPVITISGLRNQILRFHQTFNEKLLEALAERLYIVDPMDGVLSGDGSLRSLIERLTPVTAPAVRTVLVPSDEVALVNITGRMINDVVNALNEKKFQEAGVAYEGLTKIRAVDHSFIESCIRQCDKDVSDILMRWSDDMKVACVTENIATAERTLHMIRRALLHFDAPLLSDEFVQNLIHYYKTAVLRRRSYEQNNDPRTPRVFDRQRTLEDFLYEVDAKISSMSREHIISMHEFDVDVSQILREREKEVSQSRDRELAVDLGRLRVEFSCQRSAKVRSHERALKLQQDRRESILALCRERLRMSGCDEEVIAMEGKERK